ncbi:MAG: galactose mutarotase [Emcibacteraceae bacterium]|nr:galactose mutarotase [Emcibacteraceae bacterium]
MGEHSSRVSSNSFGMLTSGEKITLFRLTNQLGASVELINLGGIVVSLKVPDREGYLSDIVLGLDDPNRYFHQSFYFGAIVGRYANRIAAGQFLLDGQRYQLNVNNGPNALHGGYAGFDKKIWDAKSFEGEDHSGLTLSTVSHDGEEGYPGKLKINVTYTFDDDCNLTVNFRAISDKKTIINMSQHSYFNLKGHNSGSIDGHEVFINADSFTPINTVSIPTGEIRLVENTPMDFRVAKMIERDIESEYEQLKIGHGFDHNWVLNRKTNNGLEIAATAFDPVSRRFLEVLTDQPGLHVYTGNFLDGTVKGKDGYNYGYRSGLALETQHFPDSPNQLNFPTTVLMPDEEYNTTTVFKFSVYS